jgi:AcrR family transcriptional regulator
MGRELVDLLWRAHPDAPAGGRRGPRPRHSLDDVVDAATALADSAGLGAVTVRDVARALGVAPMSVYTHVDSRADLVVLMADAAHTRMPRPVHGRARWRTRVERVAESNLALLRAHPWLLEVTDPRVVLGPGTIAKYDHELRAFDGTPLTDLERDAALTFVLDFTRASAPLLLPARQDDSFAAAWEASAERLGAYLGDAFPVARRVGTAAGESMGAPYSGRHAWEFGLGRVLAGLAALVER